MVSEQYLQDLEDQTLREAAWSAKLMSVSCFVGSILTSAASYEDDRMLIASGACLTAVALFGFTSEKIEELSF